MRLSAGDQIRFRDEIGVDNELFCFLIKVLGDFEVFVVDRVVDDDFRFFGQGYFDLFLGRIDRREVLGICKGEKNQ